MSDLVNTFRSYALDKDNCPRIDTEVVYVRVGLLSEAADRIRELEGQHKGLVLQNALLRQRRDLPVDRIPAAQEVDVMRARIAQLEAALRAVMDDLTLIGENHWLPVGLLDDVIYVNALAALEERT